MQLRVLISIVALLAISRTALSMGRPAEDLLAPGTCAGTNPGNLAGTGTGCETSFAWGDCSSYTCLPYIPTGGSLPDVDITRWGFTNLLPCSSDTSCLAHAPLTFHIRSGCGGCDLTKCARTAGVATLTFTGTGSTARVCVVYASDIVGESIHVWLGGDYLPVETKGTTSSYVSAFGRWKDFGGNASDSPAISPAISSPFSSVCLDLTVSGAAATGPRYFALHSGDRGTSCGTDSTTQPTTTATGPTTTATEPTTTTEATTTTDDNGGGGGGGGGGGVDICHCPDRPLGRCDIFLDGGVYSLANHPQAEYVNANLGYGLRLDGLSGGDNKIFVFDFQGASSRMFIDYEKEEGVVHIFGVAEGGELTGGPVECNEGNCGIAERHVYEINFIYHVVQEENQIVAFYQESDIGSIRKLSESTPSWTLKGTAMAGAVFLLNVGEYRGYTEAVSGYGWLALSVSNTDSVDRVEVNPPFYQDWGFTVGLCVPVENDPCDSMPCHAAAGLCVVTSTCVNTCPLTARFRYREATCVETVPGSGTETDVVLTLPAGSDISSKRAQDRAAQAFAQALRVPRWRVEIKSVVSLGGPDSRVTINILDNPSVFASATAPQSSLSSSVVVASLVSQLGDENSALLTNSVTSSARPVNSNSQNSRSSGSRLSGLEIGASAGAAGVLSIVVVAAALTYYRQKKAHNAVMMESVELQLPGVPSSSRSPSAIVS